MSETAGEDHNAKAALAHQLHAESYHGGFSCGISLAPHFVSQPILATVGWDALLNNLVMYV